MHSVAARGQLLILSRHQHYSKRSSHITPPKSEWRVSLLASRGMPRTSRQCIPRAFVKEPKTAPNPCNSEVPQAKGEPP